MAPEHYLPLQPCPGNGTNLRIAAQIAPLSCNRYWPLVARRVSVCWFRLSSTEKELSESLGQRSFAGPFNPRTEQKFLGQEWRTLTRRG